ncbi:MAG: DinB family protein [Thermoanaerobaculia bacterium]
MPESSRRRGREIVLLLSILDEAFERKAWHGANLKGALRGISAREAAWRPAPRRHNIWELALHAAYWKYAVRRMLTGEKRGSFPEKGSNWFRRPVSPTEEAWRADLRLLGNEHRKLREAAAALPLSALGRRARGSKYETATLIYGIASHDLYHTGQIQLLKVLQRKRDGS